jgi:GntR family transcriptional regulator/MocR family aminotransferase
MRPSPATSPFIHIDPRRPDGLQTQSYQAIRRAILDGTVAPGARLLSSRALADDLGVSRTTTLLAYEQLTAEGYLTARHGAGTFVGHELPDDLPVLRAQTVRETATHPPLSARGRQLAALPAAARRIPGPPRAFRLGIPAIDRFPHRLWTQLVTRRLRRATLAQLDYGDPAGQLPLRKAIAAHVSAARGTTCTADQVLIVAGAQRGLELIARTLLDTGDDVAIEEPGYPGAWSAFVEAGATLRPARVDEHGLDVATLDRSRRRSPKLAYVTPSHQFPLGVTMNLPRRLALLRWARERGAWIVEDDYDSEYRYGTRPVPCLHGLAVDGRVIYVGTFSKTLFPSLRLGFVIVPADLHRTFVAIRSASDLHPPAIDQLVVADLIADGHYDRHLRRMRAACRERLDALSHAIRRYASGALHLRPVQTGLHAVVDVSPDIDLDRLVVEAVANGVELMPLSAYFLERTAAPRAIVLGFGAVDAHAIRRGMENLARAIEASRTITTKNRAVRATTRGALRHFVARRA